MSVRGSESKRVIVALAVVIAFALAACKPSPQDTARADAAKSEAEAKAATEAVRAQVRARLKDPDSARFRGTGNADIEIAAGKPVSITCGYVNAKNSFGGYTGEQPWYLFTFWDGSKGVCINKLEDCNYLVGNMDDGAKACLARVSG
jgi:hypothetical protein